MMRPPLLYIVLVSAIVTVAAQESAPDLIILNGRVFTGVDGARWAEAVSVTGERITAVGPTARIRAKAGPSTRVIDAEGRLVIPGINDAHLHPGAKPPHTSLEGAPAFEHDPGWDEIVARVKKAAAAAPPGGWIMGEIGAAVLEDPRATRFALDEVARDRPLFLQAWTGHGALLNTAALRRLNVGDKEPDPPGGFFGRMPDRETVTGMAHEYANYLLSQRLGVLAGPDAQLEAYKQLGAEAVSLGITSVQAMMTGYPAAEAARLFDKAGLPIRVRVIDFPMTPPGAWRGSAGLPPGRVQGVKFILDGTPIERFMFLRDPYSDAPGEHGRLNFDRRALGSFLARALDARVQPMFHAVGDAAIDSVLSVLESSSVEGGKGGAWKPLRPRIEHGDMLDPAQFDRAKRLGVVVVQNPSHLMLGPLFKARLGPRMARSAMLESAIEAGVPLAFGSDGPLNPFLNIMFATINGVNPAEALTPEQSLIAYTRGSAFAEFMESEKGSLTPGMLADLAILSQDIFTIAPSDLPNTTSAVTIVGGRVVHEAR